MTDPGARPAAMAAASSPTTSGASGTSMPRISPRRVATGASEYFASGAPLGRPRWEQAMTAAPWASSQSMVGTAARMRRSSSMPPAGGHPPTPGRWSGGR